MGKPTSVSTDFFNGSRRDHFRLAILKACSREFLTTSAIAKRLGKSVNTIRAYYIYPMVKLGQLEQLYATPSRVRNQAYRSKQ